MVPAEELKELFDYREGVLYGKWVSWRRKASNSRVYNKPLGYVTDTGHLLISFRDKRGKRHSELVHRIIFQMHHGYLPDYLDHINRDPSDNRIENLRPACKSLNSQNRGAQSNTKYGMRGVYRDKLGGYYVYIGVNNKRIILGRTKCIGKAWKMRKDGERKYWPDARPDEATTA